MLCQYNFWLGATRPLAYPRANRRKWTLVMRDADSMRPGEDTPWPKYHQVYLVLRQQIRDGDFGDGAPMPGELELGRKFGVSRITVRKALERLEREGAIDRHRGRGTFVRAEGGHAHVQASLSGSIENLIAMGLQTEVRVLDFGYVPAPHYAAAAMGLAPGTIVQRALRVRAHEGVPFSHLLTYVPAALGRCYEADDLQETPLLLLLDRAGARIRGAEQTITARLATPDVAPLLELEPGEPLLCIERVVSDADGRVVEYIRGLYRPDTYEHRMSFDRARAESPRIWHT